MSQKAKRFVLEYLCNEFINLGELKGTPRDGVFEAAKDEPGIDKEDVEAAVDELHKNRHIKDSKKLNGILTLYPSGINEYERMSGEEVVSSKLETQVLGILAETEQDSPQDPFVSQTELIDETGADETDLKGMKEYLKQKREIETRNEAPRQWEAKITESGKRRAGR